MMQPTNRRTFLRSSGVALALPLLDSLAAVEKRQADTPPQRLVFVSTSLGLYPDALFPTKTGLDYESTEYLSLLDEHRGDFTIFSGLSHPDQGGEHATEKTFLSAARNPEQAGFRNSISVDQYAASQLGYVTRFPSLSLSTDTVRSQSFTSSGVMVPAEDSPAKLFAKLFLRGSADEMKAKQRQLAQGRSILDELRSQTKTLRSSAGKADRDRLDEYLTALRSAEQDLVASQSWMDVPKPIVDADQPVDIADKTDLVGRTRLMMNLVPLILQTDSSRVVSVVIQDHFVAPQIDGVSAEHHNLSHHGRDAKKIAQLKLIESAILTSVGDLWGGLKSKSEADGNVFDNTTLLFGSNLGNANAHSTDNLPIFVAGGRLPHAGHVSLDKTNNTPLCNLFVHMLNQAGIETEQFGTSTGELTV